jgi:hypothetical protein
VGFCTSVSINRGFFLPWAADWLLSRGLLSRYVLGTIYFFLGYATSYILGSFIEQGIFSLFGLAHFILWLYCGSV